MSASANPHHFIDISDFDADEIMEIASLAEEMKEKPEEYKKSLDGKTMCFILEKNSTRTRVSFEVAINQLGGNAVILGAGQTQMGRGEPISDTAMVLSRYCDIIVYRANKHEDMIELANHATVPVVNALTDYSHPCQIIADVITIKEHFGDLNNVQITWIGDLNNVLQSFIHVSVLLNIKLNICVPKTLHSQFEQFNKNNAHHENAKNITLFSNKTESVKGSQVVVSDTWVSMGDDYDKEKVFDGMIVDEETMSHAASNAIFMHCMPIYRGKEVSSKVVKNNLSTIINEAENRLHAQKAIMLNAITQIARRRRRQ